jgi:hypothetical protein
MGDVSSKPRWYVGAVVLSALFASAGLARVAHGEGLLPLPSTGSFLAGSSDVSLVDYRPQCGCDSYPCCPSCPEGAVMPSPSDTTVPQANMLPSTEMPSEQFAAGLGMESWSVNSDPAGYIDNPIVGTWARLRYDAGFNITRPDRAEFIYAKYGNAGGPGPLSPPGVIGPGNSPDHVNFETFSPYFELLLFPRLSIFAEIPVTSVDIFTRVDATNPGAGTIVNKNGGIGDVIAGFKYALYVDECQYLTVQLKAYAPSGDARRGLGTHHTSIEPGLLYLARLGDRAYFMGELRHWVPIDGTDFAGNVLRYGGGISYDLLRTYEGMSPMDPYTSPGTRVAAVTEFVGWSVFGGKTIPPNISGDAAAANAAAQSASGDVIVNLKLGVRVTHGLGSIYTGWGHALTDDAWYEDLFRLEYRRLF